VKLTIGHLYPDLMNLYGDLGNIICLVRRCQWRGIDVEVKKIFPSSDIQSPTSNFQLLFLGGGQDRQQKIVAEDFKKGRGEEIKEFIENGGVGLFICGGYQLMGKFYRPAEGPYLEGLGIFDIETYHFGKEKPRCIGNTVIEWQGKILVGFENHGGRTYLGRGVRPLGKVLHGHGNNSEDGTEGAVYKNAFGTYLHGALLPKNPHFADYLIERALRNKYGLEVKLSPLDDTLEWQAYHAVLRRLRLPSRGYPCHRGNPCQEKR